MPRELTVSSSWWKRAGVSEQRLFDDNGPCRDIKIGGQLFFSHENAPTPSQKFRNTLSGYFTSFCRQYLYGMKSTNTKHTVEDIFKLF
jgi:hypothetical protein